MKMVALPRGQQRCIHGPAVNVPANLSPVCQLFLRLPSERQLIPMKLKRKLKYKSHMYDYISFEKILKALSWLKGHNPLYANININENWLEESAFDDPILLEALTSANNGNCEVNVNCDTLTSGNVQVNASISEAFDTLTVLASEERICYL